MDIQVVILAGGLATRLGELTKNRPKSLLEILGKPFLAYQLEVLRANGITDIVLCIGHLGTQIQDIFGDGSQYGVHIRYSLENKPLGTAGALKNAEPLLLKNFFVMYGDSYLFLDFPQVFSYFISRNKLGLDTVFRNNDSFDNSNIVFKNNLVTRYSKVEKTKDMVYIDYGAAVFNKLALHLIPENQTCSLEDLFIRLIRMKQLLAFEVHERFYEIGSPQGLKDFEVFIQNKLQKQSVPGVLK
jgi:N-acetyl-alpha-D-muramate 1-phosphate uridylyltransferase